MVEPQTKGIISKIKIYESLVNAQLSSSHEKATMSIASE